MAADPLDPDLIDAAARRATAGQQRTAAPSTATAAPIDELSPESIDKAARSAVRTYQKPVQGIANRVLRRAGEEVQAAGQAAASVGDILTGVVPAAVETVTYPVARAVGQTPEEAQRTAGTAGSYFSQPFGKAFGVTETAGYKGEAGRRLMDFIGENVAKGAKWISEKTGMPEQDVSNIIAQGTFAAPMAAEVPIVRRAAGAVKGAAETVGEAAKREAGYVAGAVQPAVEAVKAVIPSRRKPEPTIGTREAAIADAQTATGERVNQFGPRSAGAAEAPQLAEVQAALTNASPTLRAVIETIPQTDANVPTIMRHLEADTLPVPIKLTKGQATADPVMLSNEQNRRGRDPELAKVFNEQNQGLVENLVAIRETAAPDVYTARTIENSENLIQAYKDLDKTRQDKISEAYKALTDAAGGQFPVNGKRIAEIADASLKKNLKTEFLSPGIRSQLEDFKSGEKMTFEQFEAMRTNLAAEIRAAERAGDGNREMAASLVREAMESLPLAGKAGKLKPIADNARKLAKERFDALRADPAYKAAVNDAVAADKFFDKFVIRGVNKNVERMVETLGRGSPAHQNLAAGALNWLSDRAGLVDGKGNFSQAGFNRALKQLDDIRNMPLIFDPKTATQLRTLGNVAGYTQFQPRGSFVNNSNTLVGTLAEHAKTGTAAMIDVKTGLPVGSYVKRKLAERAERKETEKSLAVGAGSRLSDIAKEGGK